MKFRAKSKEETQKIATRVAKRYKKGGVVALVGELGAGKTTFTQGFAKALGIKEKIISPTFILMRSHPLPSSTGASKMVLYHVDLYRLEGEQLKVEFGLKEIMSIPNNLVLIEWADKIKDQLPKDTLFITFKKISENEREITIK